MKVILFDIDHTLFDSSAYLSFIFEFIEAKSVNREAQGEILQQAYRVVREGEGFDTMAFLDEVGKRVAFTVSQQELLNHLMSPAVLEKYLYPEVKETLAVLGQSATLGVFSTGNKEMQMMKIASLMNMLDADSIFIARDKTKLLKEVVHVFQDREVYIVDDRLDMLEAIKEERSDIRTIWCRRGHYAEKQSKQQTFFPDETIEDLREEALAISN